MQIEESIIKEVPDVSESQETSKPIIEKGEDRSSPESLASTGRLILTLFLNWLSKQSLPRLIGLFVGNTRDLEQRLMSESIENDRLLLEKDKEIDYLKSRIGYLEKKFGELQDSILLGKGMSISSDSSLHRNDNGFKTVVRPTPNINFAMASEVDRLWDIMLHRPGDISIELENLLASHKPNKMEIYKQFVNRVNEIPDNDEGVIIQSN